MFALTLREIKAKWADCRRCPLHKTRTQVVVGEPWRADPKPGDPLLLIVGEAPGEQEDRSGRPFVGPAGKVLRESILPPAGVRLGFICNSIACRPPGNRDPTPEEIAACAPLLDELVAALKPDGILALGKVAEACVSAASWSRDRPFARIHHPSYLLHKGYPTTTEGTRTLQSQLGKIRRLLGKIVEETAQDADPGCRHETVSHVGAWSGGTPIHVCDACGHLASNSATAER